MITSWTGRLVAAASLALMIPVAAQAEERPGNLWKTTSQMTMVGIPVPPQPPSTLELCTAKVWTQPPPPPPGQSCTQTNFQRTGNKVTWTTQCTGQMDMTGEGEITFTSEDSYSGVITLMAEGITMNVALTGTKIGECDNPIS
jgi:uncharacterized protein DUF3617